jgi:hypothetical protein
MDMSLWPWIWALLLIAVPALPVALLSRHLDWLRTLYDEGVFSVHICYYRRFEWFRCVEMMRNLAWALAAGLVASQFDAFWGIVVGGGGMTFGVFHFAVARTVPIQRAKSFRH